MLVIEVFADIWCPFAHVGLSRLVQRRDETGADFGISFCGSGGAGAVTANTKYG